MVRIKRVHTNKTGKFTCNMDQKNEHIISEDHERRSSHLSDIAESHSLENCTEHPDDAIEIENNRGNYQNPQENNYEHSEHDEIYPPDPTHNSIGYRTLHCEFCEYETYSFATLDTHKKLHKEKKMYQCDICHMRFSQAANMRRHKMRHTGIKPFECKICTKRFFRRDHLMEHSLTHTKNNTQHCIVCNKSFSRPYHLKLHLAAEHALDESEKKCRICGYQATSFKGLRLHYANRHKITAPVNDLPFNSEDATTPPDDQSLANADSQPVRYISLLTNNVVYPNHSRGLVDGVESRSLFSSMMHPPITFASPSAMPLDFRDHPPSIEALYSQVERGLLPALPSPADLVSKKNMVNGPADYRRITVKKEPDDDPKQSEESSIPLAPVSEVHENERMSVGSNSSTSHRVANHNNERSSNSSFHSPSPSSQSHPSTSSSPGQRTPSLELSPNKSTLLPPPSNSPPDCSSSVNGRCYCSSQLRCPHCGIIYPDQTLYFLHKALHTDNNPWKCNICGEQCSNKYDFNSHILSKAHQ